VTLRQKGESLFSIDWLQDYVSLDPSKLVSEHKGELGAALTQLIAALQGVSLDGLQPGDRDLVDETLIAARAALDRATPEMNHFPRRTYEDSGVLRPPRSDG